MLWRLRVGNGACVTAALRLRRLRSALDLVREPLQCLEALHPDLGKVGGGRLRKAFRAFAEISATATSTRESSSVLWLPVVRGLLGRQGARFAVLGKIVARRRLAQGRPGRADTNVCGSD